MLGNLVRSAQEHWKFFRSLMFAVLAVLVFLNILLPNHHPEFGLDSYLGFWAAFGLIGSVLMALVLKKGLFPLIARPVDYYDRPEDEPTTPSAPEEHHHDVH